MLKQELLLKNNNAQQIFDKRRIVFKNGNAFLRVHSQTFTGNELKKIIEECRTEEKEWKAAQRTKRREEQQKRRKEQCCKFHFQLMLLYRSANNPSRAGSPRTQRQARGCSTLPLMHAV